MSKPSIPRLIFVDTSALYALADKDDSNNLTALLIKERLIQERIKVITTNILVIESHGLILSRLGHQKARDWLGNLPVPVIRITEDDERRGRAIIQQYQDKDFSLADAISFAIMERLGVRQAFAFDEHFRQYGFTILTE